MDKTIFISYSHEDAEIVKKIVGIIQESCGMEVWFDSNLRGGENYFSVIANRIMECEHFVFIVSEHSIISDWCIRELEFAASERKRIVAIWLDSVFISPRIKLVIQNTHYINYYSTTDESFSDTISKAFSADAFLTKGTISDDLDQASLQCETYYLKRENIKKISSLLSDEEQGKYSVCFQTENTYLLGLAYELGIKVEADLRRAEFYYKISARNGNYDGKYLYAAIRRKQDTPENAATYLPEMLDAANHESVYALTYLGDDYYNGQNGCEKDIQKAYSFWKKAADNGGVVAMYYMSYGHRWGEVVEKDRDLAYMYALMAAEYGFPRAFRILAFIYENGEFYEKNYDKAIKMYEEAITRGDCLSLCYMGWLYGDKGDLEKQRSLYEQALQCAEKGKTKSGLPYYRMGYIYEYGKAVPRDIAKAVEFYLTAAEKEYHNALKYTVSTIKKIEEAPLKEEYLKRAYALSCKGAAYELGEIEMRRSGTKRLTDAAVEYFTKGAENGDFACALPLLFNYSFVIGNGEDREDRLNAIKWFQFFFANADEDFLQTLRENNDLAAYYYAYAIELDYDPDVNLPDREFVQFYFRKSLEESTLHLVRISSFIVDGYLFPDKSGSGLQLDVLHAEEMLKMIEEYLEAYHAYLVKSEPEEELEHWIKLKDILVKGYHRIAECYNSGKSVPKNRNVAKEYKEKAKNLESKMNHSISKKEASHV